MTAYITRAEVHDAADQIDADGRKASAKAIRAITKRGSYSTIEAHLNTCTPRDQRLNLPPIPAGLTATVASLTADLWHIAGTAARAEATGEIERAAADAAEARAAATHAGEQADRLAADLAVAQRRIAALEQTVAERDQQINQCMQAVHDQEVEAARKDGEIESLRHALARSPGRRQTRANRRRRRPTSSRLLRGATLANDTRFHKSVSSKSDSILAESSDRGREGPLPPPAAAIPA